MFYSVLARVGGFRFFEMFPKILAMFFLSFAFLLSLNFGPLFAQGGEFFKPNIDWQDCWFEKGADWPETTCGFLNVLENRENPDGQVITLPFIIFKPFNPVEGQPPVLIAGGGGPGSPLGIGPEDSAEFSNGYYYNYYSMSLSGGRALIYLDNRGVGSSRPNLDCPEAEDQSVKLLVTAPSMEETLALMSLAYKACKKRLVNLGIDLSAYNNVAAAHDIDDLREALKYEKLNVYGASYGTRIAMTYAREFPDRINALILDGIDPPEINMFESYPKENYLAFKRIFDLCSQDEKCRQLFGEDLYSRFINFLEELEQNPLKLRVTHPKTFKPIEIKLTPEILVGAIYSALYDSKEAEKIPLQIFALLNGSLDYITELVREKVLKFVTVQSIYEGAYYSYSCFDEIPFNNPEISSNEALKYPIQKYFNKRWLKYEMGICEALGLNGGGEIETQPLKTDVPTLILAGSLDPATPPSWARATQENLTNSFFWEWPNIAHGVISVSVCADSVAERFLDNPAEDPFVFLCLEDKEPLNFVLE